MNIESSDSNFSSSVAHIEGEVVLAYSLDGKILYTGGADGLVRAHDLDQPDKDAGMIDYFKGEFITSVHCSFDSLVACDSDGVTALFSHEGEHEHKDLLSRSVPGTGARCVRFGVGGRKVAIATDELLVKVIDVRSPTTNVQLLAGHAKAVKAASWNPDGSILTTTACDGSLRVWDLATDEAEPVCIKVLDGLLSPSEPGAVQACEPIWHPTGKYFALASRSHEIAIISRDDWTRTAAFSQDGHNCEIVAIAWSPNGNYLASAGTDSEIIVWETSTRQPVYRTNLNQRFVTPGQNKVCNLAWQLGPGSNALSIADTGGQITRWDSVIPKDSGKPHPCDGPAIGANRSTTAPSAGLTVSAPREKTAAQRRKEEEAARMAEEMFGNDNEDDDDGWIDDDMNGAYKDGPAAMEALDEGDELPPRLDHGGSKPAQALTLRANNGGHHAVTGQPVFQPGATPYKEKRRYLAFNDIGVIQIVDRDSHNLVSVEFHDRSAHQGYNFDDNYKFEIACLGQRGVVYSCPERGDFPSVINYRPYTTWSQMADWQLELPKGESVTALGLGGVATSEEDDLSPALGTGLIVAATTEGYLRFFSASGLQNHLIDMGEEIVALTVGKEWIFVVHRSAASTSDGWPRMSYTIIDVDTFEIVQQGQMPLLRKTAVTWIGFTSDEMPAIYKSNGVLSILARSRRPGQARWIPVLDTNLLARREGKQESYWPVSVSTKQLHCVILKGEEKHPFFPTPLLQEFALQVPAVGLDGQQGLLEETYLRESAITGHIKDGCHPDDYAARKAVTAASLALDKQLLVVMQIACKAEKLEQALEAARMMTQPATLDAAIKLAGFFHHSGLQEKIGLIKETRTGESEIDRERRDSKWGHLVDNRTIVDSTVQIAEYQNNPKKTAASTKALLSKPLEKTSYKRSLGDSSGLNSRPVAAIPKPRNDSGMGSSEPDFDEVANEMDEDENSLRMQVDEPAYQEEEETQPVEEEQMPVTVTAPMPKPRALNPFAKAANVASSTPPASSNPFARKAAANGKSGEALKKSNSFFDRVEGNAPKGKGKKAATKDAPRQSTLFGLPPVEEAADTSKKGKGKKRKSTAADEEEAVVEKPSKKAAAQAKLSFGGKASTRPEEETAENDQPDVQENEPNTETAEQSPKRQRLEEERPDESDSTAQDEVMESEPVVATEAAVEA